jgi:hypothetical protein
VTAGQGQLDAISGMWVRRVPPDRWRCGVIEPPSGSAEKASPLGGQTDAGCEAGAPPGQVSPGGGGKMRPCAWSLRLTREATGKAGAEDDSAEAACRRASTRCAGVSCR